MPSDPLADTYSRTALLLALGGAPSLDTARTTLEEAAVTVRVGPRACRTPTGQGAALTAVSTLARVVGHVEIQLADPDAITLTGVRRNHRLVTAIDAVNTASSAPPHPGHDAEAVLAEVLIGDASSERHSCPALRVSWDGWLAMCGPSAPPPGAETQPLAGAAAAAMACSEVLGILRGRPTAGHVLHRLDLWNPLGTPTTNVPEEDGPEARRGSDRPAVGHLPPAWHLVGLGHLGQAAAWCLTLLPYPPDQPLVYLHDPDRVVEANVSTGVLTTVDDRGRPKTRLVADALEAAGARTCLIERRLGADHRREARDPAIALVGVDNPHTRRTLSAVGWDLAVDLGVGRGARDFSGISMHCLTAHHRSDDILAWKDQTEVQPRPDGLPEAPAFQIPSDSADGGCGIVQLATRAAGASFVGILAATLGISEVIKRQYRGPALRSLHIEMNRFDLCRGTNDPNAEPIMSITAAHNVHHPTQTEA